MKKNKIAELLTGIEFTNDEIQEALDALPDEFAGKPLKANINKYFKKDGTAKAKKQEGQEWHDTQGFIRRQVRTQIHINRLRKHVEAHKQLIKEKKTKTHRVGRHGKIEKIERVREDGQ